MWSVIINGVGIYCMSNVCVLSRYLSPVVEVGFNLSGMFMCLCVYVVSYH